MARTTDKPFEGGGRTQMIKRIKSRVTVKTEDGERSLLSLIETQNPIPGILDDGNLQINIKNSENIGPFQTPDSYFDPNYQEEHSMRNMHFSLHPSRKSNASTLKVTTISREKSGEEISKVTSVLRAVLRPGVALPVFTYSAPKLNEKWKLKNGEKGARHVLTELDQTRGSLLVSVYATLATDMTPLPKSATDDIRVLNYRFWKLICVYGMNFAPSWDFSSIMYAAHEPPKTTHGRSSSAPYPGLPTAQIIQHHQMNRQLAERSVLKQVQHHLGDEAFDVQRLGMTHYSKCRN